MRLIRITLLAIALGVLCCGCAHDAATRASAGVEKASGEAASIPARDIRVLIADAIRIAPAGDRVWPGYSAAPFGVVLVEANVETVFCHPSSLAGFEALGRDAVTGCGMQVRARSFDPRFLATFPAFEGISTIIVGTPAATGLAPVEWTTTLLHEHFHQMQSSQPGYYAGVAALDLSGGDETGMWMLDYPFPYDDPAVGAAFAGLVDALDAAVQAIGTRDAAPTLARYLAARAGLQHRVSAADWRYAEFQLWQEGVARWTEIAVSEAGAAGRPDLAAFAAARRTRVRTELLASRNALAGQKRIAFYAVGASEAMLLDAQGAQWRTRYFREPFALGAYFPASR